MTLLQQQQQTKFIDHHHHLIRQSMDIQAGYPQQNFITTYF
jgi:predicted TIM-barrel fold metal-dependent hydrolase